jgi:hypothetical protein
MPRRGNTEDHTPVGKPGKGPIVSRNDFPHMIGKIKEGRLDFIQVLCKSGVAELLFTEGASKLDIIGK